MQFPAKALLTCDHASAGHIAWQWRSFLYFEYTLLEFRPQLYSSRSLRSSEYWVQTLTCILVTPEIMAGMPDIAGRRLLQNLMVLRKA